jgi:hypothetical protein
MSPFCCDVIAIFGDHIEKLLSRIEFQTADIDAEDPFRDELLEEVGANDGQAV